MLPKIASALARVLDPIRPIARPGASLKTTQSSEGGEGGYGALGYAGKESSPEKEDAKQESPPSEALPSDPQLLAESETLDPHLSPAEPKINTLPFQPGLTQVILEVSRDRRNGTALASAGSSLTSYENGAKDQKKASRLPKGSMLDRKAG